jgi:hypothetical protein
MYEPQLVHNPFNLNGLKSLRANLTVQPLSRPRIKGCPISRSFFARCGIPRLPIYTLRLSVLPRRSISFTLRRETLSLSWNALGVAPDNSPAGGGPGFGGVRRGDPSACGT